MKLIAVKIAVVFFCIPVYPLALFADWYQAKTNLGGLFNFKKSSTDYWADVGYTLTFKKVG